jgi:hypothetical protein
VGFERWCDRCRWVVFAHPGDLASESDPEDMAEREAIFDERAGRLAGPG